MVCDSVWVLDRVWVAMRNENLDGGDVHDYNHLWHPHVGLAKARFSDGDAQRAHCHWLNPYGAALGVGFLRMSLSSYFDDFEVDFVSDRNRSAWSYSYDNRFLDCWRDPWVLLGFARLENRHPRKTKSCCAMI